MKDLYVIKVKHHSPGDSHVSIQDYVIADTEEQVADYVMKLEGIEDREEFIANEEETYWQRWNRTKGSLYDEDVEDYVSFPDAYNGITLFGWEYLNSILDIDAVEFCDLGVIKEI